MVALCPVLESTNSDLSLPSEELGSAVQSFLEGVGVNRALSAHGGRERMLPFDRIKGSHGALPGPSV